MSFQNTKNVPLCYDVVVLSFLLLTSHECVLIFLTTYF
jgi:hypothetical protein